MRSHKRIIIIFMLHPRAARGPLKPVHLSRELQWWQEPNTTHLLKNASHHRRWPSQAKQIKGIIGHTPLLYCLRVALDKEALTFHLAVCQAGTAIRLDIGQEIAPIPRRTTTRSRVIQMDVRDTCTIPPWKRFPLVRLS